MAGKNDIVEHVVNNVEGLTKKQASEAVEAVFACLTSSLSDGEKVAVAGFGTFNISHRAERQGRNPQTGESITIKAGNNVRFKAGKQLKDAVND
ncbi:MAG: HU family DNA-binding protein [Acidobacteriota bacterium]